MKKTFLTTLFILSYMICFGQNYIIKSDGVESVVADYAKEIIDKNIIVKAGYEYELILSQDGDALTISYVVNPNNIIGKEYTNDLWNEIEQTIKRALNAMNKQIDDLVLAQKHELKEKEYVIIEKKEDDVTNDFENEKSVSEEKSNFFKSKYEQVKQHINKIQENNQIDKVNQQNFYNGMKVYNQEEVIAGMATIGSLMQFPDGSKGVIYYLKDGHGLAVSLDQTKLRWQDVDDEDDCYDIPELENTNKFDKQCAIGQGEIETYEIMSYKDFPAAYWCVSHGEGWYLPSVGELYQLLYVSNARNAKSGLISVVLTTYGGAPFTGWYWCSSEENAVNAYNISASGSVATEAKNEKIYVRAIRQF